MAHRSRPALTGTTGGGAHAGRRPALRLALLASATAAGFVLAAPAHAQYQPYNPFAGGPVPYSALQGGGGGYQVPYAQYQSPGYAPAYGGTSVVGGGSIVYDRSVIGGGYQAPFYAGIAGQPGVQAVPQYAPPQQVYGGAVAYGAAPQQGGGRSGAYGQAGGLLVPGPSTPRSELYIQPGVAAPGYAQTQVGIATGAIPSAPVATVQSVPTTTPQIAAAQTTTPTPPAQPQIAPPPPPASTGATGPDRVPVIVSEPAAPPTPPAPPSPPPVTDNGGRSVEEILQPPPPPPTDTQVATAAPELTRPATPQSPPPAPTPSTRSTETTAPNPPPVEQVEVVPPPPPPPTETASTEDVAPPPTPVPTQTPPSAAADGETVALSIAFPANESELPAASQGQLAAIAQQMLADESLRLTIRAYAEGSAEEASQARRLSLSRALAVRTYLIDQGIRGPRMDVRALGHRIDPPRDRVDLVLVSQ
ncbi:MAG: OmpA family protein [Alphaproteobacteria bacterium]